MVNNAAASLSFSEGLKRGIATREEATRLKQTRLQELDLSKKKQESEIRIAEQAAKDSELKTAEREVKLDITELSRDKKQIELEQLIKSVQNENTKQKTFSAFTLYNADGNPRHLNEVLKDPNVKKILGAEIANISIIDLQNDLELVNQAGLELSDVSDSKRFLKVTNIDGTTSIIDMIPIYAGTGYSKVISDNQRNGLSAARPTAFERNAAAIAAATGSTLEEAQAELLGQPAIIKKQKQIRKIKSDIFKKFGGEDKFFKTSFEADVFSTEDPEAVENFRDIADEVIDVLELRGGFSAADVDLILSSKALVRSAAKAADIGTDRVGLIDNAVAKVKQYFGLPESERGVAAWRGLISNIRNELFGATLTNNEQKDFEGISGTLNMSQEVLFTRLAGLLSGRVNRYRALAALKDPFISHTIFGQDIKSLSATINKLESKVNNLFGSKPLKVSQDIVQRNKERQRIRAAAKKLKQESN